ncbi:MAG: hypothetical protein HZC36_14530 [Armatimonadetes bacterium]|nr:hypothetical protein [Armatimonadota bacterium]
MAGPKLTSKELGIAAAVVVIGAVVVFATTKMFGGSNESAPQQVGKADSGPADGSVAADDKPNESAN